MQASVFSRGIWRARFIKAIELRPGIGRVNRCQ
jgi:hypothetical protein